MARKASKKTTKETTPTSSLKRGRPKKGVEQPSYLDRIETEIKTSHSKLSMVLGALIILVLGVLIFNYFNRPKPEVGPSSQTNQSQAEQADVSPNSLPGKYTVKEDDTLFTIAEKYYQNGDLFTEIAKANNLNDPNTITTGQVLTIPKVSSTPTAEATPSPVETPQPTDTPDPDLNQQSSSQTAPATNESSNETQWGPVITGNTYTVVSGDWLSKISGRAYGDIFAYQKIALANNIKNPNLIEPGTVLVIPRG